jgi:MoaF C-terminal domain/MoaF N-terminal domain
VETSVTGNAVPDDWKSMDDFAAGIDANRLPATDWLSGSTLTIRHSDGTESALEFVSASACRKRGGEGARTDAWYEAVQVRPSVFFVDQLFADDPLRSAVTVFNTTTRRALTVTSRIAAEPVPGAPRVSQTFVPGVLDGDLATGPEPAPSRDLIGWRALYRYSPAHLYEHVYLSSERYAWQCLVGEQRGHGDVDLATTWKFDEDLYVFTFREFKIAVAATWLYDLAAMRSTGKFFGIGADGSVNNSPGGAHITSLGRVDYPDDGRPV